MTKKKLPDNVMGLPTEELFVSGHGACPGCGPAIAMRIIAKAAGKNSIIVHGTGCMEVVSSRYPMTSWKIPWIHGNFGNPAPIASGIHHSLKMQGKRKDINLVVIGGDGSTYDIGFGAISGALERGDKFTYISYDNESYANTGIQCSGATPYMAGTSTTPVGDKIKGKMQFKKPITQIVAAHNIPYVATATVAYPNDLYNKIKKSFKFNGSSFINVLTPCVLGWDYPENQTIEISRLAVDTGMWLLYEIENGKFKLNVKPKMKPVEKYLKMQKRFKHLTKSNIKTIQHHVNEKLKRIKERYD